MIFSFLIPRLISNGKDEVAFNILQRTPTSQKKIRSQRAKQFLEQLVKSKRPVSKLLWFAEEMSRQKLLSGGLELILQTALAQDNFPLSLKLAEIYVADGHALSDGQAHALLLMAKDIGSSPLDVMTTIKAIGSNLSEKEIKETVIPHFEKYTGNSLVIITYK